jgi:chromosomal replication initiation ATPase DnaA
MICLNIGAAGSEPHATCLKFSDIFHHETKARRRTMSHLGPLLTFESFVPSAANRRGYLAALLVSERAVANTNPLFIHGPHYPPAIQTNNKSARLKL